MTVKPDYDDWEMDALTEICNIGAGHAATALSELLDRTILIGVPAIEIVGLTDLPEVMGGAEAQVTAVYVRVTGDAPGSMLFMLPQQSAISLAAILAGHSGESDQLSENARRTIKEAGSVVISSYLEALSHFLEVPLVPDEAHVANDMAGAVLGAVVADIGIHADYALIVQTEFMDESTNVVAKIGFLPDHRGQEAIMRKLHVK